MTAPAIELTNVDAFVEQRHHDMFTWLRANEPVFRDPSGFWALTRYDDIAAVYADHTTFSSAGGPMLGGSFSSVDRDTAANRMLVASDPPRHRMLRQLIRRVFTPDYVARITRQVEVLVNDAVDKALAAGGCDFAVDIAPELPAGALMSMTGISRDEAYELIGMTRRMIGFRDPNWVDCSSTTTGDERLRLAVIQSEIFEFFADILRSRRRKPGEDLVSILATAEVNGRPLPEEDILYNCMNVAVGGNETSSYSAVAGVLALIEHPDQHRLLVEDVGLVDLAVNEILRWATTNAYVLRVPTTDVVIGDRLIPEGDPVTLWNLSANRDEKYFPDGDRFLVSRSPNRHITYGTGIHRCIGSVVAKAELSTLFGRLTTSGVRFDLAGDIVRLRSNFIQGITSLPVRMSA